jgi:hypothetical protein
MTSFRNSAALVCALAASGLLCDSPLQRPARGADEPNRRASAFPIQRVLVPANRPEAWPKGPWEPVLYSELQRYLSGMNAPASGPRIERARYQATLVGPSLLQGTLRWEIRQNGSKPAWMVLDATPVGLHCDRLTWDAPSGSEPEPAIDGSTGNGRWGLLVDRDEGTVSGNWSLSGRLGVHILEFEPALPPAEVASLELTLPADLQLSSSQGVIAAPPEGTAGPKTWLIELGGHRQTRLTLRRRVDAAAARPLLLTDKNMVVSLRRDVARIQVEFQMQALEAELSEFELAIPPEIELLGIAFGDGGSLEWRESEPGKSGRYRIALPELQTGKLPMLVVHCLARLHDVQVWPIPDIRVAGTTEMENRIALRLPAAQEIGDIRLSGYRQVEQTAHPTDGETRVFRQIQSGGTVTVVRSAMRAEYGCQSLTLIRTVAERLQCETEIRWNGRRGRVFSADCRIPDGWEVVDIRVPPQSEPGVAFDWNLSNVGSGPGLLTVRFREPLLSRMSRRIHVVAKRTLPPPGGELPLPVFAASDPVETEALIVCAHSEQKTASIPATDSIEVVGIDRLPDDWEAGNDLRAELSGSGPAPLFVRTQRPAPDAVIVYANREAAVAPEEKTVPPEPANPLSEVEALVVESMNVELLPSCGRDAKDRYSATFHVRGLSDNREFRWQLDYAAELRSVSVSGMIVIPQRAGGGYSFIAPARPPRSDNNAGKPSEVLVEYDVPSDGRYWPAPRRAALPAIDHPVEAFRFALQLPQRMLLTQQPEGIVFPDFDEARHRQQALLGPWGAHFEDARRRFREDRRMGSNLWKAATDRIPDRIVLHLTDADHRAVLCWCAFLGSLLWICVVKRCRRRGLGLASFGITAACVAAVFWAPSQWADLFGSVVIGNAAAWLIPLRLLARQAPEPHSRIVPQGSTQSFAQTAGLLFCCFLAAGPYDSKAQEKPVAGTAASSVVAPQSKFETVLIPGDNAAPQPAGDSVVYVSPALAGRLKSGLQADLSPAVPEYVLTEALYVADMREDNSAFVTASFEAVVLSPADRVPIVIALSGVSLAGADACRVDGEVRPVVTAAGGGYLVSVAGAPKPAADQSDETGTAPADQAPDAPSTNTAPSKPAPFVRRLELKFFVPGEETDRLLTAGWGIPRIVRTRLSISGRERFGDGRVVVKSGPVETIVGMDEVVRQNQYRCGPADAVSLQWTRAPATASEAPRLAAAVSVVADLDPRLVVLNCQVDYQAPAAPVSALAWNIPREFSLRSLQAADLLNQSIESAGDHRRLVLEFSRPQKSAFSISAVFAARVDPRAELLRLPVNAIVDSEWNGTRTAVTLNQFALRAGPDHVFEIDTNQNGALLRARSIDEFAAASRIAGPRPQQAFLAAGSGELPVRLKARTFGLTTSVETAVHVQRDRANVVWQIEVEPHALPVFHYRLRVDPRWRIENVSVHEDGVERILRWSESGETLAVFLRDQSTARQLIFVEATLPLTLPAEFSISQIRLEEGTPRSASWTLFPVEGVDAVAVNADGVPFPLEIFPGERDPGTLPRQRILAPDDAAPIRIRTSPSPRQESADE